MRVAVFLDDVIAWNVLECYLIGVYLDPPLRPAAPRPGIEELPFEFVNMNCHLLFPVCMFHGTGPPREGFQRLVRPGAHVAFSHSTQDQVG
jgi:hypothetical protein